MKHDTPQKWWVLVAVGISTFMSALDSSVVNIVIPVIHRELAASVVIIYLLLVSGPLLFRAVRASFTGAMIVALIGVVITALRE